MSPGWAGVPGVRGLSGWSWSGVVWRSGEGGAEALPGGRYGAGPAPGGVDAEPELAGASGDAGRDVQDPVAEGADLATGQIGSAGETDQLGPGHQISGGQDDLQPGSIGLKIVAGYL